MGRKDDIVYGYYDDKDAAWSREHIVPTTPTSHLQHMMVDTDYDYRENDSFDW